MTFLDLRVIPVLLEQGGRLLRNQVSSLSIANFLIPFIYVCQPNFLVYPAVCLDGRFDVVDRKSVV